jgi:glycerol-1-phosphate dehydrogenase [NAD(P)+]
MNSTRVAIPTFVRIKSNALDRLGIYLSRFQHRQVVLIESQGLTPQISRRCIEATAGENIEIIARRSIVDNDFEQAIALFTSLPKAATAIVGLGGGKALDLAKYVSFLAKLPYFAVPTSLSNDGFSSPQASLTVRGKRRSLAAAMPFGVVVDPGVCLQAPRLLTLSGVGDLAAKFTAIFDWKLAFRSVGEPVDDFAALLTDSSVHAFLARPVLDEEGIRILATSLLFNGIAMEVCGSSRPASGSEHLISHALDELSVRPRLHGLQVGVATYLMSLLQHNQAPVIAKLFEKTGFWDAIAGDKFVATEWLAAIQRAPTIKENYYTILSTRDVLVEVDAAMRHDPWLSKCFEF